jgi:hypothetical protein
LLSPIVPEKVMVWVAGKLSGGAPALGWWSETFTGWPGMLWRSQEANALIKIAPSTAIRKVIRFIRRWLKIQRPYRFI